jgi:hypothetical protein
MSAKDNKKTIIIKFHQQDKSQNIKPIYYNIQVSHAYKITNFQTKQWNKFAYQIKNVNNNVLIEINNKSFIEDITYSNVQKIISFDYGNMINIEHIIDQYNRKKYYISLIGKIIKSDLLVGLTNNNIQKNILVVMISQLTNSSIILYLYDEDALQFKGSNNDIIILCKVKITKTKDNYNLDYINDSSYFINEYHNAISIELFNNYIDYEYQ